MIGTRAARENKKKLNLSSESYVRRAMPQSLRAFDLTMIFVMVMFFVNNPVVTVEAGFASFTYWIIGALVFFIPCIIATAQLGTMFFHEGSLYNWTQKSLGNFWSFFVGVTFWASGVLAMVGSAGLAVSFLQGLNSGWLAEARAQGVFIVFILILASVIAMQPFRIVQSLVTYTAILMLGVIALLGLAALIWLVPGHSVATNLSPVGSDLAFQPGNYVLFSTVILAFLGANVSMTMGGEIADRKAITHHLFWGGAIVLASYLIVTFALLVVLGPRAAAIGPFSIISVIDQVFGKFMGDIAVICVIVFFIVLTALLNSIFARFLLVGAIDRRLPVNLGRLDENRVPLTAIIVQTTIAVLFAMVVFLLPYLISLGNPVNLTNELFTVTLYAHSMLWILSSAFLFINIFVLYVRDRKAFHEQRIFPMPVLWACIIVAPLACVLAIIITLSYSPIPQLIPTNLWGSIVGGLTVFWLFFAAICSMLATSEAAWEDFSADTP
ncbi:MAG: amino acid permease [Ktedonobacteraceae bacterium]